MFRICFLVIGFWLVTAGTFAQVLPNNRPPNEGSATGHSTNEQHVRPVSHTSVQSVASERRVLVPAKIKRAGREAELLTDIADGRLNSRPLWEAAWILGDTTTESNGATSDTKLGSLRWQQIVDALEQQMANINRPSLSTEERARRVLTFLHENVLTGHYFEHCNSLGRAFQDGDYNCVTATVLFCCLARHCDISVVPVSLPGHVCCRLDGVSAGGLQVEATDPNWQPSSNEQVAGGRSLTDVQLLAKLLYNRGLRELRRRDFAAALSATELSWQLDQQHDAARDNVATVINNWALELARMKKFQKALSLLERGRELVPDHPILYANEGHIRSAWQQTDGS